MVICSLFARACLFSLSTYSALSYFLLSIVFEFSLQFFAVFILLQWMNAYIKNIFYTWQKSLHKSEDNLPTDKNNCQLHHSPRLYMWRASRNPWEQQLHINKEQCLYCWWIGKLILMVCKHSKECSPSFVGIKINLLW